MKLLSAIVLLSLLVGCGEGVKQKEDKPFHSTWGDYIDSFIVYNDKYLCALKCNDDTGRQAAFKGIARFKDSADKYYLLMYPNGNPAGKTHNCNCQ